MESFNIDTAISLLPLMDDTENVTKQLISAIEVYNTHVNETTKPQLINFVLKTRLSESAKFKLGAESKKYGKVQDLLTDMKKQLLAKKSAPAIQQQLVNSKQNDRNIDEYGKEIETLFMDLTISQADGDTTKTGILKPINEKLAITQFAKGLKNQKLSTIVTARNYQTLELAIQGAKDEESILFPAGSKAVKEGNHHVFHPNPGGRGGFGHNAPPNRGYPSGPAHQNSGGNQNSHLPSGKPVQHSGENHQNTSHSLSGKAGSIDNLFSEPQYIGPINPGYHHGHNNSHWGNFGGNRGGSHATRGHSGHTHGGHSGNNRGGGHSSPCTSASIFGRGHSNRGLHNNHGQNHAQKQQTHPKPQNNQNHSQNHPQKPHTNQNHPHKQHTTQNHPQKQHTTQHHPQKPHTTQNNPQKPHTTQNNPQKPHTNLNNPPKQHKTQNHPPKPPANQTNKNSGSTGNKNSFTQNKPKSGGTTEILVKIKIPKK